MALTKVSGQIIDQPFDVGIITATNQYVSGIGTFGNIRVLGDLQVDGTTTTLDTIVTEVDRLEVAANNNTVGVAITQSGTGDIFNLYDGSTEVFSVADGGDVSIVDKIVHTGDTNTAIRFPAVDTVTVETGGSERVRITSGGKVGIGTVDPAAELEVYGNGRFKDADGSHGIELYPDVAGLGYQRIISYNRTSSAYEDLSIGVNDFVVTTGSASERLRITSDGKVRVPDNGKFTAGASDDLQIYHDGTNSSIQNTTGYLYLYGGTNNIYLRAKNDEDGIVVKPNNSVELYYDNSKKFETSNTGVTVTGNISCGDDQRIKLGNDQDLLLYHDGSNSYLINETGDLNIRNLSDDKDVMIQSDNGSGGFETYIQADGSTRATKLFNSGSVKLETSSGGVNVTGELNVTTKVAFPDSAKAIFGAGDDLQIYHDGNNSWISDEGTGSLKIRSVAGQVQILGTGSNDNMAVFTVDGASELYYDNSKKLETTATGAKVTGALEVTQEYPSIRPILDLNFAATKTLDRRITFRRGSIGTFTGEDGLVKYASNNVPRFDHDPTTGESLGLLIEESSTNTKTNSQVFTSGWNRSGIDAVTQNTSIVTPSGSTDSTGVGVLTESSGGTSHQFYAASSSQVTKYITYSIFAKPNGRSHIQLVTSGFVHNLADGTTSGSASGEFISAKTEKLSNGWCRCSVVRNHSNSYDQFNVKLSNGSSTSYSGDGSSGVYIWGAQQEDKAFLTSYIPTSGTTVTRAQDTAKITGTNFTDFYNQAEGTLVAHYHSTVDDNYVATFENVTTPGDNKIGLVNYAGYQGFVETGNSGQASLDNGTPTVGAVNKVAFAFKTNDFAVSLNSTTPVTDTSGTMPTVGRMMIGSRQGGAYDLLKSTIRHLSYYNKRLPNAQLQGLTQQ